MIAVRKYMDRDSYLAMVDNLKGETVCELIKYFAKSAVHVC